MRIRIQDLLCFLQLKKTIHDFFSSSLVKLDLDLDLDANLDPDLYSEKLPDPDLHKVNADPQPCMPVCQTLRFRNYQLNKASGGPHRGAIQLV